MVRSWRFALGVVVSTLTGLCALSPAQQVDYPTWAKSSARGGTSMSGSFGTYVPPEYNGPHQRKLALFYFQPFGQTLTIRKLTIRHSPLSGILAIRDLRESPGAKWGWDTGLDRIHHLNHLTDPGKYPVDVLITGWDDTANTSKVIKLTVPETGLPRATDVSVPSGQNELWTSASVVGSDLYLLELQSMSVQRMSDTNADGIFDVKDPMFSVTVPGSYDSTVPASEPAKWVHPVIKFAEPRLEGNPLRAGGVIDFVGRTKTHDRMRTYVDLVQGQYELKWKSLGRPARNPVILDDLMTGQGRVSVFGPGGATFELWRQATPSDVKISKPFTLPAEGYAFVDVTDRLRGGWKIRLTEVDGADRSSELREVAREARPVLFRPRGVDLNQRQVFRFDGDQLRQGFKAFYALDDGPQPLETMWVSARKIDIKLPQLGSPASAPPYTRARLVNLWLQDANGAVVTVPKRVWVLFD